MSDSADTETRFRDLIDSRAVYLVTGGGGFIGSNLVRALVEAGATVRVLDDFSTGRRSNLEDLGQRVELIEGSVDDPEACASAVAGVTYVLHLAAVPSVPRSVQDPLTTHAACATGTLRMLAAARDSGVSRVVYASSSSAYGNASVKVKAEGLPTSPLSPYAVAKLSGEQYCRVFWKVYGLETVALRYFNIFGPQQDPHSQYSAVVPLFVNHALNGTQPTIFGDGEQTRDFTYVSNAVWANLLACRADVSSIAGRVFNVACGAGTSVNQLWDTICEIVGVDYRPIYAPPRPGEVRDSFASLELSRSCLGYDVLVDVKDGLQRTVEWYAERVT